MYISLSLFPVFEWSESFEIWLHRDHSKSDLEKILDFEWSDFRSTQYSFFNSLGSNLILKYFKKLLKKQQSDSFVNFEFNFCLTGSSLLLRRNKMPEHQVPVPQNFIDHSYSMVPTPSPKTIGKLDRLMSTQSLKENIVSQGTVVLGVKKNIVVHAKKLFWDRIIYIT